MAYAAGFAFPFIVAGIIIVRLIVDAARGSEWEEIKKDLTKKK